MIALALGKLQEANQKFGKIVVTKTKFKSSEKSSFILQTLQTFASNHLDTVQYFHLLNQLNQNHCSFQLVKNYIVINNIRLEIYWEESRNRIYLLDVLLNYLPVIGEPPTIREFWKNQPFFVQNQGAGWILEVGHLVEVFMAELWVINLKIWKLTRWFWPI